MNIVKLPFLLLAVICCFQLSTTAKNRTEKPNIILILADDLGYGDLSCYGSERINTPNIDRLAQSGIQFTQFYAGCAVCTPTRVSIMTGLFPTRLNAETHFNDREMFLQSDLFTIPKGLKKSGYTSKHIGKWHLGGLNEKHVNNRSESMPGPIEHGFDHYLAMLEDPLYRMPAMLEDRLYKDGAKHLVRDEKIIEPIDKHWTDVKTDEALGFITEQSETDSPFFLNLWYDTPHAPYEVTPESSMAPYRDRARGVDLLYRGMVTHLDNSVGRVVAKIKELGIEKNTLIIFTSDNGPAYQGSPGPFKGRKVDMHEGGIRVPAIAVWKGTIKPNSKTDQVAHTVDLLPTFCSVANAPLDENFKADGQDIMPILKGSSLEDRGVLFWTIMNKKSNGNYGITTDNRPSPNVTQVVRKGDWKLLARDGEDVELYNLREDRYERWNMKKDYPKVAEELLELLTNYLKEPRVSKPY